MVEIDLSVGESVEYNAGDRAEQNLISNRLTLNPSLEFYINENIANIDKALFVGAGVGVASKILTANGKEVINIEPITSRFTDLETNCASATNINKACASTSYSGTMYYFDNNKSGAKLDVDFGEGQQAVDVITVDSLDLTDLDLLVITTNGSELDILDGCVDTLTDNPDMKVIINWTPDLMDNIDYKIVDLKAQPFSTYKIIHWDKETNDISFNNQYTGDYPNDNLKIVEQAMVLME